jgi:hypothetical protein
MSPAWACAVLGASEATILDTRLRGIARDIGVEINRNWSDAARGSPRPDAVTVRVTPPLVDSEPATAGSADVLAGHGARPRHQRGRASPGNAGPVGGGAGRGAGQPEGVDRAVLGVTDVELAPRHRDTAP